MRRKRRTAYKKWKLLNATICEPQPADQAFQKNLKDCEKEVKGDTSEAMFHRTAALGKSEENRDEQTSASVNGKQNSSFLPLGTNRPPSHSKISREKEDDDSLPSTSHQLKQVLPVVTFNDCKESLAGKITPRHFSNTAGGFKPAKGKIITAVKCGNFNVRAANKTRFFCKTEMHFPTKKRCPKCDQCYSTRHIQRCNTSRSCSYKYKNILIELKSEAPSKHKGETARTESPSLRISIVGKGVKIEYTNKKQNIIISIARPKRRQETAKYGSVSSDHTTKECFRSSAPSDIRLPKKRPPENQHQHSDRVAVSPSTFAVQKEQNPDIVLVSLCSASERKNKPGTLFPVLDNHEFESAISQQKDFKISQNILQKKHFFEAKTLLKNVFPISHNALKTRSLSETDLSKMPLEDPKDVDSDRKINFDIPENITPDSRIQQSSEGINYLPSTITNNFPVQDSKNSDFYSSSSLKAKQIGEKAANIDCKGSKISSTEYCDHSNSKSFPSSQNTVKSSIPFCPEHQTTRHSEPKKIPGDTLSLGHFAEFAVSYEEEQVNVNDTDFNKATSHSDSCTNTQQLLEMESTQRPAPGLAPRAGTLHPQRAAAQQRSHSSAGPGPTESQVSQAAMAAPSGTKVSSVSTSIADELERRLIIQNDKEDMADSNGLTRMKNLKESPSFLGNVEKSKFLAKPVVKNTCHRDSEDLSNEKPNEVCFQMDFPANTAEFNSAVCATDDLFLIEKPLSGEASEYSNQGLGLTSFKQEAGDCQGIASISPHTEGDKNDPKKNYYHWVDMLLPPQMQKALKDWNLEINSLLELPPELPPRGTRVSDGSQEAAIDQWARKRQQFKDGKRCSSAGASSFASSITEGSITSEDGRSVDLGFRVDIEEKGFYTENFHSAAWVFQGDGGNPEDSPRCLSKKPRPVSVRERTVRLFKGTGDYPWGFRIQFSKPIVITEVDTNSAAEEAGLQIGDVVLAVNGTEVTSVEHAEAVHLARKGPDVLTLVVASDISRCPSTPRATCRGYLHKRTRSGFVQGWRKRWFALKCDGCLRYYRHKKDEGQSPPLDVIKLEGAEVEIDSSLGKPFVFNCVPRSGNRTFCFCATSKQEMKRWLEAMGEAAHPIHQSHVWEGVTLHNSSLPPLAIKNPECLGLLHRLDGSTDMWVQHYCVLKDGCLYLYASIRSTQASGGLYLQGYRVKEQTLSFKQSVIELQPPSEEFKTFYFCAENKRENQRWITALKTSIKKWLPLHQAIQDFINRPLEETRM